ncbi:MAG: hypothetical protein WC477_07630 [Patescibacteria group bacterium]
MIIPLRIKQLMASAKHTALYSQPDHMRISRIRSGYIHCPYGETYYIEGGERAIMQYATERDANLITDLTCDYVRT